MTTTSTMTSPIKTATASEAERVISTLVLAFGADPVMRWLYPEPNQYLVYWPEFTRSLAGRAFEHGTAYYVGDYAGAALWLPPSVHCDGDRVVAVLQGSVAERSQGDVFAVLEQMGSYYPSEPYWYLPFIGVDPTLQGRGYGSVLLQHVLALCDRDNTLAHLESSNPRNIPLYERHGFEVRGTIQAGASPTIYAMTRKPRSV